MNQKSPKNKTLYVKPSGGLSFSHLKLFPLGGYEMIIGVEFTCWGLATCVQSPFPCNHALALCWQPWHGPPNSAFSSDPLWGLGNRHRHIRTGSRRHPFCRWREECRRKHGGQPCPDLRSNAQKKFDFENTVDYRSSEFSNSVNSCISAVKGQQEFLCSNNCGMYYVNLLFLSIFSPLWSFLSSQNRRKTRKSGRKRLPLKIALMRGLLYV